MPLGIFGYPLIGFFNRIKTKYEVIAVFENALLIEEMINDSLQKWYRELQIKKSQPQSLSPVYLAICILGILLLFAITNPSAQDFQAYHAYKGKVTVELKDMNRTNLIIFSRYQVDGKDKAYWGVLGNFF